MYQMQSKKMEMELSTMGNAAIKKLLCQVRENISEYRNRTEKYEQEKIGIEANAKSFEKTAMSHCYIPRHLVWR